MKQILFTTLLIASFGATTAHADDVFADSSVNAAMAGATKLAVRTLDACLSADIETASNRAIRACTQAYKESVPNYDLRSQILTRRGQLYFSTGDFNKASRDFASAGKLSDNNKVTSLGKEYAALVKRD